MPFEKKIYFWCSKFRNKIQLPLNTNHNYKISPKDTKIDPISWIHHLFYSKQRYDENISHKTDWSPDSIKETLLKCPFSGR